MAQSSEIKLLKRFDQDVEITGNLTVSGTLTGGTADTNYYLDGITKSGNTLTFSVNGATNQTYTFGSNAFTSYTDHSTQGYLTSFDITTQTDPKYLRSNADDTMSGTLTITGSNGVSRLRIEGTTPTIDLDDSDGDSFYIHVNSNNFYILADRDGGGNYGNWETPHPLQIEADTSKFIVFGNDVITSGNIGSQSVSYASSSGSATSAGNSDTLDGQHGNYYDHRRYTDSTNYLGGYYVSGGTEKPNSSVFGAGKLKIAMLRGGSGQNLGFSGTWNDVLWISTYTGSDVKRSSALVFDKYDNTSVYIVKQSYDATDWGTGYLFWNSGNDGSGSGLDADTVDGLQASSFLRSDADDSTTGQLTVESGIIRTRNNSGDIASIRFSEDTANDHVILEYDGTGSGATNYFHMYSNVSGWATKGSSFNMQPSTGNINIGATNFGYNFRVDGTTYLSKTTIEGTANGNDPTLKIISTTSNTFNHAIEAFNSNLTTGEHNIVLFGQQGNTKNSGYIGYYWSAAGSNNNFVTIGHWGADDLFRVYPDQITGNSSFRAPIFYDINNTGYYIHGDDTSRLNLLNVNAVGTSVGGIGKVMFPYGAEYNGSGTVTGAFKITLPQSWTNTMMTLKVTIYDYAQNESFEVHCGGYNYTGSGGYWVNTHAKIIANGESDRNFNVRFGHDGSKCCILIGETASTWAYPKVVVTEWVGGHSNETFSNWDNGWDISVVTTLPSNIDLTRSNNQIGRYQSITYDTGNTNYYSDPASISNFNDLRFLNYLRGNGNIVAQCTDSYLRINQSGQFSNGIWFGDSHLKQGSNRYIGLGGNGGTTSSRVWLYGGAYTGTNVIKIDGSTGIIQTTTDSVRAPRFYDYDNTGYYVDPASTSILERLYIYEGTNGAGAQIRFSDHASGSYGQYGTLEYVHADGSSYGSGNAFKFYGSEASMSFHVAGQGLFTGDIVAYYSDMRLKTKIGDIQDPISKIKALNGFYYEPNEKAIEYGYEKERRIGLSAQEVKEVVPEAVTMAAIGDNYLSVDYAKLVPVLVEAIKEQQKQIDELKSLINKS